MQPGYITTEGHARLVAELTRLHRVERPKMVDEVAVAAAHGDRSENAEYKYGKKRLREIDSRLRWLEKRLASLTVVDPSSMPSDPSRCFFGALVTVEGEDGDSRTYRIVGEDESDADAGRISYRSPLGRALLGKGQGDALVVQTPSGPHEYSVTRVQYGSTTP